MNTEQDDEGELTDEEIAQLKASPWAIEAGLLEERDGEILITPKGFAALREMLEKEGLIPKQH